MKATDFATCPSVKGERACQLEAALAIDPVPSRTDPLNVANNAQVARKQRILFRETPFCLLEKQAMFGPYQISSGAMNCARIGSGRDQSDMLSGSIVNLEKEGGAG
ncbi:MAG TPA: hypothetical protein VNE61_05595 [Ktedonobacteraceae bacterium]|nr:hypothetical protein [Ktedonobacteraceae bacterium]